MNTLVGQDSFDRFARLVRSLIPSAAALALCDSSGKSVHLRTFDAEAELLPAIEQLCNRHSEWVSNLQCCHLQAVPGDGRFLFTAGLCDAQGEPVAALVVLLPAAVQHAEVTASLKTVIECIEHEIATGIEFDAMTVELTERYEELNLVYHTEDQVNFFRQGREALKNLTQNCLDYLDVGLAVLILKEKEVAISCSHADESVANVPRVTSRLADGLYSWVQERNEGLVINEMSDPLAISLLPGVPYRVLCCPVRDKSGDVAGILATVNNYSKNAFSNSDKNLMQVMARKASKIVIANYDNLTGLMNRNGFEYFLTSALTQVQATDAEISLLHINIDQLHIVNDTVGHAAGDAVIRSVAASIVSQKRDHDTLSRLGGDEFGLILNDCSCSDATDLADRIRQEIACSAVDFEDNSFNATVSIGVAPLSAATESVAQAIGNAELACSMAKDQGQNRVETYHLDNVDMIRREEQMYLVAHIQRALTENRFRLFCQPIQALASDARLHHTEILLRLLDDKGEILAPGSFIPAAERYHLMPSIDRWVVSKTLRTLAGFDAASIRRGIYAINLSGQSFNEKNFLDFVHAELKNSGVPPESICFEITETAAVANIAKAVLFMNSLRDVGCSFSLDDFGSGISSFGYLKSLPVDYLKIDGMIVKDIVTDPVSEAMVAAINTVGHTMNLRTIAEFVENDAIKARLAVLGVDYVQGYGIGKPGPLSDRLHELMTAPSKVAS